MKKKTPIVNSDSLFPKLDNYFANKQNLFFYLSLFLLALFGVLLFDLRISVGGDDSGYLQSAKKFATGEQFPTWHGTFYIMVLGWIYKIFGFHLTLFKFFSLLFLLGHQALTYYTFKGKVSPFVLSLTLLILSVNSGVIYYGSQTYSEPFYMLAQSFFLYIFIKHLPAYSNSFADLKSSWLKYLILGLSIFLLSIVKNLGIIAIAVVIIYFLSSKKFYSALFSIISFSLFKILFGLYKKVVWGMDLTAKSGQFSEIILKDPYNATKGQEDFAGMMVRIGENIKIYLSRVLMQELGLKDLTNTGTNWFVGILIIVILLTGLFLAYRKKNEALKVTFLYIGGSLAVTFIALQQMWAQTRMILPYIHLIVLCFAIALGMLATFKKLKAVKIIAAAFLVVVLSVTFLGTVKKSQDHQKVLSKNLAGNKYYGYSPDWVNFLKMSAWSAKRVDKNVKIASRKPSMSFIYGDGREFYAMYRLPIAFADSVMADVDASHKAVLFIKEKALSNKPGNVVQLVKKDMLAAISIDNTLYSVFLIDQNSIESVMGILAQNNIAFINSADEFRTQILNKGKEITAIIPDQLVQKLIDNDVEYAIVANLRVNPKQKTGRTINTVARYLAGIQLKYPAIFTQVHQIGHNDAEPARLYKLEFDRYNLKKTEASE